MKVFVVYDSKYGNTKLAAESILKGMKEVEEIDATIGYFKKVNVRDLADCDVIVLGAPNHMGRPSRIMENFVDRLAEVDLKARAVAVFDTYSGRIQNDRAIKKLARLVTEKLPSRNLISPSLSVRVTGSRVQW